MSFGVSLCPSTLCLKVGRQFCGIVETAFSQVRPDIAGSRSEVLPQIPWDTKVVAYLTRDTPVLAPDINLVSKVSGNGAG